MVSFRSEWRLVLSAFVAVLFLSGTAMAGMPATDPGLTPASPVVSAAFPLWPGSPEFGDSVGAGPAMSSVPGHAEYLAAWGAGDSGPARYALARRVGYNGDLRSAITATTEMAQYVRPAVAYSPVQGQHLIAYVAPGDMTLGSPIRASLVSWDGSIITTGLAISSGNLFMPNNPVMAYNSQADEFLVVYSSNSTVRLQRVNASDGARIGGAVAIPGEADTSQSYPSVAYDSTLDRYLVAYQTWANQYDIRGRVLDSSLVAVSPEITIVTGIPYQMECQVAAGPGEYLVVWTEGLNNANHDIRARRVSGTGTPLGSGEGFQVAGFDAPNTHRAPSVSYMGTGAYLVAWMWDRNGFGLWDIQAREVTAGQDGSLGTLLALDASAVMRRYPSSTCLGTGDCLLAYAKNTSDDHVHFETWGSVLRRFRVFIPMTLQAGTQ